MFIPRKIKEELIDRLNFFPVVALVGPRQVGKTELVNEIRSSLPKESIYLDLETAEDSNKLQNPALFLNPLSAKTVILDEIQWLPGLFKDLRGIIDKDRQPARFILLGSASPDLIRESAETLAGRISYLELTPFYFEEIKNYSDMNTHWFRGGFPLSLLAPSEKASRQWRRDYIYTYLHRDLRDLGLDANPIEMRRFFQMLAFSAGNLLNTNQLSKSLGISRRTINRYLDFLESAYLVRRLEPWYNNAKKRMVKSPKLYLRDTGLLHELLTIQDWIMLNGHPMLGHSFENYVIEQIAAILPDWAEMYFYRTYDGTEVDVLITRAGKPEVVVEIKYSATPKTTRGMHSVIDSLGTTQNFIVCPIKNGYPIDEKVSVVGVWELEKLFNS
ncbi:MAG: ATP-binding protein [Bacteroidia bacterium]